MSTVAVTAVGKAAKIRKAAPVATDEVTQTKTNALRIKTKPGAAAKKSADTKAAKNAKSATKGARKAVASVPLPEDFRDTYKGASGSVNKNRSRTHIDHSMFATAKDAARTERDEAFLKSLRSSAGQDTFQRSRLDAGLIRRCVQRGLIKPVSGEGNSESDTYKLTAAAFPARA